MPTLSLRVDIESMDDDDLAAMLAALLTEAVSRLGVPDLGGDMGEAERLVANHLTPDCAMTQLGR
jgi:hypothetical protein